MNFQALIKNIEQTHKTLQATASKTINKALTIRNWLIGFYIVEFEQNGEDRAKYGEKLVDNLAENLDIKGLSARNLKLFRQFYLAYPQIQQTLSADFKDNKIVQTVSAQLTLPQNMQTASAQSYIADIENKIGINPSRLISCFSFSHFTELIKINDPLKRTFYELECIKGNWSVRELERQINSLYFERSGLSKDKKKLSELVNQQAIQLQPKDIVNTLFTFEFLGVNTREIVKETELEQALLDNLQYFLRL